MATWDDQMAVLMGASTVAFGRTVMYSSAEGSVSFPVQAIEVDPVADDTESPGNWAQLEMNLADFVANGISGPSKLDSVLDAGTTYIVFDVVVKRVMKTVVLKLRRQDLPNSTPMPTNYPRDGVNAIVAALRTLPDFLDTVSDPNKIQAYQDAFPQSSSWGKAIRDMPIPGVLVAYQGTDYGAFGGIQTDIHHFVVVMRAKFEDAIGPDMTTGYYRMIDGLVNGVPNLGALPDPPANQAGQKMRAINGLVPSCHAMTRPSIERLSDAEGLDYFQAILSFPQAGDF